METNIRQIVLWVICGVLFTSPARAADAISATAPTVEPVVTDGWTFSVTPYFWAAGLSGETSAFGLPVVVDIDADFSDVWDNLDFAAMAIVDARHGRYSIFGDLIYTKLSADLATPRGVLATTVDVTAETFAGLVGAGYSVLEGPSGHLDIVGGIRVWSVDVDLSLQRSISGRSVLQRRRDLGRWPGRCPGQLFVHPSILLHGLGTGWRRRGRPGLGCCGRSRLPDQ